MRVLIACEYSGKVRDAFAKRGHFAMSCDLLSSDNPKHGVHYPHTLLSKFRCKKCGKPIKARLVLIKQSPPKHCYKCSKEKK